MAFTATYATNAPSRPEVDALSDFTLLEFGTDWCGHCQAVQSPLAAAMTDREIRHLKIEDGPGRALGRSFRVKLWPTLILLHQGQELARLVRPTSSTVIAKALDLSSNKSANLP